MLDLELCNGLQPKIRTDYEFDLNLSVNSVQLDSCMNSVVSAGRNWVKMCLSRSNQSLENTMVNKSDPIMAWSSVRLSHHAANSASDLWKGTTSKFETLQAFATINLFSSVSPRNHRSPQQSIPRTTLAESELRLHWGLGDAPFPQWCDERARRNAWVQPGVAILWLYRVNHGVRQLRRRVDLAFGRW